ncbi:MAG TPA: cytochrome C oxidase subunit IV family protein [Planctomycetota bacterium]|jgi:cytochrome c oxidase subunit 4|nr:cytochrome C oxidase subunit IV family protein [Planctomycetota bacterium]
MSHNVPSKTYTNVLWALLALTIVTVAISRVHLGTAGNVAVGLLVAVIKASLVTLFFMHLKYEQRWWTGIVLFPLTLVLIIIFANLPDTGANRDFTTPAAKVIPKAGRGGSAH